MQTIITLGGAGIGVGLIIAALAAVGRWLSDAVPPPSFDGDSVTREWLQDHHYTTGKESR